MIHIPVYEPIFFENEEKYVLDAIKSKWVSSKGKYINIFEERFSQYCDMNHGVATSNGTTALHLALLALELGPGDEVILPTMTFVSCANVIKMVGAAPIFIDSDPEYWCIDVQKIEEKITNKTKAIMPVHLYGHPCDMDEIIKIAKKYDLYIIEDCAEAHGALYKNKKIGSFSDISCFSFYGNKIITTGEGGMCLTKDENIADKIKILRDHGMNPNKKYWHDVLGYNYRMTNLQAALGVAQLENIEVIIKKKRDISKKYSSKLNQEKLKLHKEMPWCKNVFWMYSLLLDLEMDRDTFIENMYKKNIETRPFFYPIHTLPHYKINEILPVSEHISKYGVNLPSGPTLTSEQIEYVCDCVNLLVENK